MCFNPKDGGLIKKTKYQDEKSGIYLHLFINECVYIIKTQSLKQVVMWK